VDLLPIRTGDDRREVLVRVGVSVFLLAVDAVLAAAVANRVSGVELQRAIS
jgi:hypothetical protein